MLNQNRTCTVGEQYCGGENSRTGLSKGKSIGTELDVSFFGLNRFLNYHNETLDRYLSYLQVEDPSMKLLVHNKRTSRIVHYTWQIWLYNVHWNTHTSRIAFVLFFILMEDQQTRQPKHPRQSPRTSLTFLCFHNKKRVKNYWNLQNIQCRWKISWSGDQRCVLFLIRNCIILLPTLIVHFIVFKVVCLSFFSSSFFFNFFFVFI